MSSYHKYPLPHREPGNDWWVRVFKIADEAATRSSCAQKKSGKPKLNFSSPLGWAHLGSNQGPMDYESTALTD